MKTTQGDKDAGIISSDDNGSRRLMIWRNGAALYANGGVGDLEGNNFLSDGQWHHYALTKEDAVAWKIYRDGVQVDSSTASTGFVQGNAPLRFARHGNGNANARWPGALDDVGLWDEAVSPQRVALISGLGKYSNASADDPGIDGVLAAFNAGPGNAATAGGNSWRYASAAQLSNPAGTVGLTGGQAGVDAFIVLDASGNGVQFNDQPQWAAIGAGPSIPHEAVDTANGARTNVDEGYSHILSAGRYRASDFSFAYGQSGSVTPFLAKLIGDNQYQVLAVGDMVTVAGSGAMSVVFGGSDYFVLDAPTRIYGGIVNPVGSSNPVYLDDGTTPFLTDHNGGAKIVSPVGQILSGFSNPNLGRTYAFAINVQMVPEPGTVGLALVGLLGLALAARRKGQP
jgi:hypothetical protein